MIARERTHLPAQPISDFADVPLRVHLESRRVGSSSAAGKIKKQKDNLQKLRDEAEARGEGGAGRTREGQVGEAAL